MERTYTKKEVIKKQIWTFVFGLMAGVFLMGTIASEKAKKKKKERQEHLRTCTIGRTNISGNNFKQYRDGKDQDANAN